MNNFFSRRNFCVAQFVCELSGSLAMQFSGFFSNWMFPEMRMFSKSASAKKLTDGERYSCSATLPRRSFSVIIVSDLLIFEA